MTLKSSAHTDIGYTAPNKKIYYPTLELELEYFLELKSETGKITDTEELRQLLYRELDTIEGYFQSYVDIRDTLSEKEIGEHIRAATIEFGQNPQDYPDLLLECPLYIAWRDTFRGTKKLWNEYRESKISPYCGKITQNSGKNIMSTIRDPSVPSWISDLLMLKEQIRFHNTITRENIIFIHQGFQDPSRHEVYENLQASIKKINQFTHPGQIMDDRATLVLIGTILEGRSSANHYQPVDNSLSGNRAAILFYLEIIRVEMSHQIPLFLDHLENISTKGPTQEVSKTHLDEIYKIMGMTKNAG